MIILYAVCLLCLFNLFGLMVYCDYKKKRAEKRLYNNPIVSTGEAENNSADRLSQIKKIIEHNIAGAVRFNLIITGYIPSHHVRNFLYKHVYRMSIEKNVVIYYGAEIREPWNIRVGEGTIIGDKSLLDGRNGIVIGKNVNFSTGVWIYTLQHDYNDANFGVDKRDGKVVIDDRAWVSTRTTILPGVHIGEGAVIAACAVVTKDIPGYVIAGGVPAKVIGKRNTTLSYEFDGTHFHFL